MMYVRGKIRMIKKRIFGYVDSNSFKFLEDMRNKLYYDRNHRKASKSRIIELALLELHENNDMFSIERKLIDKKLI